MPAALTAALLGVALVVCGFGFGSPSLLVPGIGLTLLAVGSTAWVGLAAAGLRLARAPAPHRIVEGEPYPLRLTVRGGLVPPPGGELVDALLRRPRPIGPRWRRELAADVPLRGRGLRRLGSTRLVIRDPLGLWAREIRSADAGELIVLPRVEPVVATGRGAGGRSRSAGIEEGVAASRLDAHAVDIEVDGLRPYRDGSPASRIHWPAVARSGELIERRLVAGGDAAPLVVLDASAPASGEALDAAVRATASLCVHLARAGGCAVLLPGDRRPTELEPELRGWTTIHTRLALLEAGGSVAVAMRAARTGTVIWVTARAAPRLPAALRAGGPSARYLVAPSPALGGPAAFEVAGCRGVRRGGVRRPPARAAGRRAA
jgi:uncharacterized protein (DUF58 family)